MLSGDLFGFTVGIYVSLNYQVPRLLVDNAKVTGLFCGGTIKYTDRQRDAMLTSIFLGGVQLGHFETAL